MLSVALLLTSRDEPATFDTLRQSGAAFGLVINASQLRKALSAHLEGREYRGRVELYKASLLRMADSLAVSYRWNAQIVTVAGALKINMSDWQIQETVNAIKKTRCPYVWLDSCAVPEKTGSLKSVLLARMMAVYASARYTLVLISRETDSNRYHQVSPNLPPHPEVKQRCLSVCTSL